MVQAGANKPRALLAALKTGNHYASQGLALHGIHREDRVGRRRWFSPLCVRIVVTWK